ncbi:ankyrin repeat protein [Pandoravirus inopinatum]|uniref:Ankyrin repeat protein n=1 Tax=Pandoravirus inopinatum TaxID=1605721 RepID=A0A0B5J165_9VIRU|nr:ankyrin repeat protein [Pandoravirus inopinatum]AJF97189.1 ankyrin repeat protein [Pandoravirus inopinatum]
MWSGDDDGRRRVARRDSGARLLVGPCVRLVSTVPLVSRRWQRVGQDAKAIGRPLCVVRQAADSKEKSGYCALAAKSGHLDCLIYARARGRPWGRGVYLAAAAGGHLDILRTRTYTARPSMMAPLRRPWRRVTLPVYGGSAITATPGARPRVPALDLPLTLYD